MGWSGTVIGAILGSRLGGLAGPWGAVIGGAVGGIIGWNYDQDDPAAPFTPNSGGAKLPEEDPVFEAFETLFRSYGRLAKSDGVVSREEADLVGAFLRQTGLPADCRKRLIAAFNAGKQSRQGFGRMVNAVKNSFNADAFPQILSSYCDLVLADGVIHRGELAMLREAEAVLEQPGFVGRWLREVRGERSDRQERREPPPPPRETSADALEWAYRLLGVTAQSTDDEVKKAWRAKAKEYHPDVLRGKGVEESVIKLAEIQMRRVNDAYEAIRRARHA